MLDTPKDEGTKMRRETQNSPIVREQLKNKNVSEQMRVVRGYAIISKGDTPKQVGEETFTVPSQSGNGEYKVTIN